MLDDTLVDPGTIASDFCIRAQRGRLVLSIIDSRATLPDGLFPDASLVSKNVRSDAFLTRSSFINICATQRPTLRVSPGLLRTPPVPRRVFRLNSATLSRVEDGQRWPERVMAREGWLTPHLVERAEMVLAQMLAARVGGACWAPHQRRAGRDVVVATVDPDTTWSMLQRAIERGAAERTILAMPRPGRIGAAARRLGVAVLDRTVDPWPLIEGSDRVYAHAGSEAAFLATMLGKEVACVGHGPVSLTSDRVSLVAAVLLRGTRYTDPFTGEPLSCEAFLDIVSEMRRQRDVNGSIACCVGISFWKRRRVTQMLGAARPPAFRKTAEGAMRVAARRGGGIAVWASRAPAGLSEIMRLEDGFVRSVGLGADFLPPLSLVLDCRGIYYDATAPSDLERLLSEATFDDTLLRRAAALRRRMVMDGVTKYNLPSTSGLTVPAKTRVILVPGQVADDRSVLLGGGGVRPGLDLLQRVRRQAPEAHILYKPHPDVDAGHRLGAVPDADVLRYADQIVRGGSMAELLAAVHEVHTLTSLAGFEALLRDKPVTTYGQPFYAGWGLTTDLNPPARRHRGLRLDELVAGTIILYPSYFDPVTALACGPETVLDRLADPALHRPNLLVRARRAQGRLLERARRLAIWKDAA